MVGLTDMKKLILTLSLLLLASRAWGAAGAHYCDCTVNSGTGGAGTFADPFESINDANDGPAGGWENGDDLYFKTGERCEDTEYLSITWNGTSDDGIVIGAYEAENDFVMEGGETLPILDGNGNYPSTDWRGLITGLERSYVTVQDIEVRESKYGGIRFAGSGGSDNIIVQRCVATDIYRHGIEFGRVNTGLIQYNTVSLTNQTSSGASIEITGGGSLGASNNVLVKKNKVFHSYNEGIGFYKGAQNCTAEYNVVYECKKYHMYIANAKDCTFRFNLVYEDLSWDGTRDYLMAVDAESAFPNCPWVTGHKVHGNILIGGSKGISLGAQLIGVTNDAEVYNNTLVDNDQNFNFGTAGGKDVSDAIIKNNLSYTTAECGGSCVHSNNYSPTGVDWSHNFFDDGVSGNAATNEVTGNPNLAGGTTGYRSLTGGAVTGADEVAFVDDTGDCDDAGTPITGYTTGIYATGTDFTASPPDVVTSGYGTQDIGAFTWDPDPAGDPGSCDEWYDFTGTKDQASGIGAYVDRDFIGPRWTQPSDQTLCEVDMFIGGMVGSPSSSHDYWMRVFTVDGNNDLATVVATSTTKIDGDGLSAGTWISENEGNFEFDDVALSNGVEYAFTIFVDQDANQSDDPEADGSNFPKWGFDDENNSAPNQDGLGRWTYDASIPYVDYDLDAEDDLLIKIHTITVGTSPAVDDVGIWNAATLVLTDNSTTTISSGTFYIGLELDEEIIDLGNPDAAVLKLAPTYPAVDMVGKFLGQFQDTSSSKWVLVWEFRCGYTYDIVHKAWNEQPGQRITDLVLKDSTGDGALDLDDGEGTATFKDGDGNDLDTDTNVDSAEVSSGTLPLEVPKKNWKCGPDAGDHYATYTALVAAIGSVAKDRYFINGPTEDITVSVGDVVFMIYDLDGNFDVDSKADVIAQGIENVSGTISNPGTGYQGLYFSRPPGL